MGLNLGLECLAEKHDESAIISYEFLDSVFQYNEASEELTVVFDRFDTICQAAENLASISEVIAQHGVSPALEALVGGNFAGGLSAASVEAAAGSVGETIKNFLVRVWQAIKEFINRCIPMIEFNANRVEKVVDALKAGGTLKATTFKGLDKSALSANVDLNKVRTNVTDAAANDKSPFVEVNFASAEEATAYGNALRVQLSNVKNWMTKQKENTDKQLEEAKKLATETDADKEARAKLVDEAKNAKAMIQKTCKALLATAAAFLAHVKVEAKKDEPAKEDETK